VPTTLAADVVDAPIAIPVVARTVSNIAAPRRRARAGPVGLEAAINGDIDDLRAISASSSVRSVPEMSGRQARRPMGQKSQ
jgi:hypothetical protein